MAEFTHNNRVHEATKLTPFQVMYGTDPKGIPTAFPRMNAPAVEERLKEIILTRQEALAAHELARQAMIQRQPGKDIEFNVGDQVWLESKNLNIPMETRKFKPKREGPFKILEKLSKRVYKLKLPFQWKIHPVFHSSLLTPYHETQEHGTNFIRPPPDLIDGQEEYEVEAIIRHHKRGHKWVYLTKWKGYRSNDNMWEPEEILSNAKEILEEYKKTHNLDKNPKTSSKRPSSVLSHSSTTVTSSLQRRSR